MKLSDNTLKLLNNFSTINSGITVKSGNEIATVSAMKNIFAKAVVDETFEQEHSIYDLSEYLGAVSLFGLKNLLTNDDIKLSERLFVPSNRLRGFEKGKVGPVDNFDYIGGNYVSAINFSTSLPQLLNTVENVDFSYFIFFFNSLM